MFTSRHSSPAVLMLPLAAALVLGLTACSAGSPGAGSSSGGGAPSGAPSSAAPAGAPGSVSTDGVCGLVPISKVNSILKRSYIDSKEVPLPDITISNAAYCVYGTASKPEQFEIQVANGDIANAVDVFNEAAGNTLAPQSGIGDSALFASSYPELVVVWGQKAIAVGQSNFEKGDAKITLAELEKLATAVHSAG